jgi:NAD(P)-dependent dehydrogenase (short-subunit alcohol dehydrogenase family)
MIELSGRTAVITGGASGIGLALAERLGRDGVKLVIVDIEEQALDRAVAALFDVGCTAIGERADVTDFAQMQALAERTRATVGVPDILVNNAGVSILGPTWEMSLDDWKWVLGVNLRGVIHGIKAFVPMMRARGTWGHIVDTASSAAIFPIGTHSPYCSSKAAVASISHSLQSELRAEGSPIGVSCLCPGMVDTQIHRSWRNRPEQDVAWSDREQTPAHMAASDRIQGAEIKAADVAEQTVRAALEGKFWVFTHERSLPIYLERVQAMASGANRPKIMPEDVWTA